MASEISTQHEEVGEGLSSFPMETQEETQQDHWLTTHPTSLALSPIYSPVIAGPRSGCLGLGKGGLGSPPYLCSFVAAATKPCKRVGSSERFSILRWGRGLGSKHVLGQNAKFSSLNKNHPNPQGPEVTIWKWKTTTNKLLRAAVSLDFKRAWAA